MGTGTSVEVSGLFCAGRGIAGLSLASSAAKKEADRWVLAPCFYLFLPPRKYLSRDWPSVLPSLWDRLKTGIVARILASGNLTWPFRGLSTIIVPVQRPRLVGRVSVPSHLIWRTRVSAF